MNRHEERLPVVADFQRGVLPYYLAPPYQGAEEEAEEASFLFRNISGF